MSITAEEFRILCDDDEDTTFAHQTASLEVWTEILNNYPELARCVAGNKNIPDDIIDRLSKSSDIDIRWKIATKRKLNRTVFERLAIDSDATVRHRIACNPKVPKDILQQLSKDPDPMVASSAIRKLYT
ncbi:hypothetical protein GIB19_13075 [Pseudomonas sp. ITEM 17296]|jgi:hypothetical protein|uniref:hypothetical protein n=1 Tax=unclassified Pseudomonas TaxID=196821 RepID=UPI0012FDE50C|nr:MULTISPECIES: hypothetical protein [unclassified Pseudomonas]MCX2683928.1 hypothetical protein [Pseudomonas sp. DCB_AW]MDE4538150.1 hypothetical protein [Pseudomonas sp. ITEM 17296]GLO59126.1 hypothetical protein PPUJ20066_51620 [Pseudomonas putida]